MKAVVTSEVLGQSVEAAIVADEEAPTPSSEDAATDSTSDTQGLEGVVLRPNESLAAAWAGQDVRVSVVGAQSAGEVLAVPVTAVFGDPSGGRSVVVVEPAPTPDGEATQRRLAVTVGVVGGGWAEVTPVDKAGLDAGMTVMLSTPTTPQ
jgi:hypothetical protein